MTGPDQAAVGATDPEPVGSVAEEAFKLFRALTDTGGAAGTSGTSDAPEGAPATHTCTTTWCPVCQVVGFVRDNPDALATVATSAAVFARSLRDLVDTALSPQEEQ